MNDAERMPSRGEGVACNDDWDMRSPQVVGGSDYLEEADSQGYDEQLYMDPAEMMGDKRSCALGKPGEELNYRENAAVGQVVKIYGPKWQKGNGLEDFHEGVIGKLGWFLDVPGYVSNSNDGDSPTRAQGDRLEELYQVVAERSEKGRSLIRKIVNNPAVRGAFTGVLMMAMMMAMRMDAKNLSSANSENTHEVTPVEIQSELSMPAPEDVAAGGGELNALRMLGDELTHNQDVSNSLKEMGVTAGDIKGIINESEGASATEVTNNS